MRLITVFLLLVLSGPAFSSEDQIQSVITQQLTAFLNNDGRAAWVHAHPSIKAQFNTPERFMAMVEQGYEPLMNFTELDFVSLEKMETQWLQTLTLKDTANDLYTLYYSLMEVEEDRFQITGVFIEPLDQGI